MSAEGVGEGVAGTNIFEDEVDRLFAIIELAFEVLFSLDDFEFDVRESIDFFTITDDGELMQDDFFVFWLKIEVEL